MTTKPGEAYRVDLGLGARMRLMIVVSRNDTDAPRALSLCVPITTASRKSPYEVELLAAGFLSQTSFANVQGLQAVQHHELRGPIGIIHGKPLDNIRDALRYALDL